jgi:hypothetical protein
MIRYSFSRPVTGLALLSPLVVVLALAGCGKQSGEDTQNPDSTVGDGGGDGSTDVDGASAKPSKARGSTSTRSAGRNTKARKMTAKKPVRAPIKPAEADPVAGPNGLLATAFSFAGDSLPEDFSSLGSPLESFEVPNLDFDEIDASEGFPGSKSLEAKYALQFTGSINVVEEAEYELCLHSDDGSQLLLEGMLVVDNNGVHESAVEACELVYLAPGEYMLEIRYLQVAGPLLTLHMAWAINDGDKVIVPTEVLFKPSRTN